MLDLALSILGRVVAPGWPFGVLCAIVCGLIGRSKWVDSDGPEIFALIATLIFAIGGFLGGTIVGGLAYRLFAFHQTLDQDERELKDPGKRRALRRQKRMSRKYGKKYDPS